MKFDPQKHHRRSIRLPEYDYSQPGAYFITLVAHRRECRFGEIRNGKMHLNDAGQIVWDVWNSLPERYPQIALGLAVVMPNHFHGIMIIAVGAIRELPLHPRRRMTLPMAIGYFKMNSAKRINETFGLADTPIWQRNYYEHIIRDDDDHCRIQRYIQANIDNWGMDDENPLKPI